MEAPRAEIGEVVSEPPAEPLPCGAEQVGGDAVPALWGSGIGVFSPVPAECAPAQTCGAKLGGNAKILRPMLGAEDFFFVREKGEKRPCC